MAAIFEQHGTTVVNKINKTKTNPTSQKMRRG
jgi:hypothetical protein